MYMCVSAYLCLCVFGRDFFVIGKSLFLTKQDD